MLETEETPVAESTEQPSEEAEQVEESPSLPDEQEQPVEMPNEAVEPPVDAPAEDEPVTEPTEPDIPEQPEQSDIPSEETPDEPVQEDMPADDSHPGEEPADDPNTGSEEQPVIEDAMIMMTKHMIKRFIWHLLRAFSLCSKYSYHMNSRLREYIPTRTLSYFHVFFSFVTSPSTHDILYGKERIGASKSKAAQGFLHPRNNLRAIRKGAIPREKRQIFLNDRRFSDVSLVFIGEGGDRRWNVLRYPA